MTHRTLKLILYVLIAVPLMGMENISCVSSRVALSDRNEGFIDTALLGTWGFEDELHFAAALDEDGDLALTTYEDAVVGGRVSYSAYSSMVGGRRYLNAKFEECASCSPEGLEEIRRCPYYSVRYAFDLTGLGVPPDIQAEMESEADEANEFFYSNRAKVFFQFMNPEFVRYAIENGDIEGDSEPRDSICITASQEMLRDFVARPERQVFYVGPGFDEYWIMGFVRLTPAEVRSCGFGKERLSGARPLTDLGYRNGVRKMHMRFRR